MIPLRASQCSIGSEELPMTMQVGMVGADGIVLAGDTRRTRCPELSLERPWMGGRFGEDGTKMQVSGDRKVAVSSALCLDTAERIGAAIIARLDISKSFIRQDIEVIAKEVFGSNEKHHFQCLVVVATDPKPRLFCLEDMNVEGEHTVVCQERNRLAVAGDTVNAAIFWAELYYNQHQPTKRKAVKELVPLCAHLVVCAQSLNTATIGGLEMAICMNGAIELQLADVTEPLAKRAEARAEAIARMVFNDE